MTSQIDVRLLFFVPNDRDFPGAGRRSDNKECPCLLLEAMALDDLDSWERGESLPVNLLPVLDTAVPFKWLHPRREILDLR
jgi:hypothetical protein